MAELVSEPPLSPEAESWVAEHVGLAGVIRLFHERPWGTVWQVPVVDGAAWLKVCAPVQAFEPYLTAALARRWPGLLPEVLGHEDACGWLLLGDAGERLGFGNGSDPCVSHPFLTLFVPLLHLEEMEGLTRDDMSFARMRDGYLERWGRPVELREAFELAIRIAPFANLFKELRVLDSVDATDRHLVTGLSSVLARCIASADA